VRGDDCLVDPHGCRVVYRSEMEQHAITILERRRHERSSTPAALVQAVVASPARFRFRRERHGDRTLKMHVVRFPRTER
jgi:hypothetical protein